MSMQITIADMKGLSRNRISMIVSIDVSKDKLDIAVLPQGQTFAISHDAKPFLAKR